MSTQPSEGAVRAAKALENSYGLNPLGNELDDIAHLIERETGVGELQSALAQTVVQFELLIEAFEGSQELDDCQKHALAAKGRAVLRSVARQVLSRHTSTQGKEGKL